MCVGQRNHIENNKSKCFILKKTLNYVINDSFLCISETRYVTYGVSAFQDDLMIYVMYTMLEIN